MKRRGFLMNSAVLLLLIPLLLLIATYEDASSMIIASQGEKVEIERTFRVTSYLEEDFKNTLSLSTKRAIALTVDYATAERPLDNSSRALEQLVMYGHYSYIGGTNSNWTAREKFFMKNNTIRDWLRNMKWELRKQGYIMKTSPDDIMRNMKLTIAPLDSFHIVVNASIPNIVIEDLSGKVVYNSSIPQNGSVYVVIPIEGIEDPLFPHLTKGRASRIISACKFAYPSITPPYIKMDGYGQSSIKTFSGQLYNVPRGGKIFYGDKYISGSNLLGYVMANQPSESPNAPYIFNTSLNGKRTSPLSVFSPGDIGVMTFDSVSGGGTGTQAHWCEKNMEFRTNMTLPSTAPLNSLVLLVLNPSNVPFGSAVHDGNAASIRIYKRSDTACEMAPYWIEYWGDDKILIWLNTTDTRDYTVYYSTSDQSMEWEGNIALFPVHNESVTLPAAEEWSELVSDIPWESFFVRYSLKAESNARDFDSGVEMSFNSSKCLLVVKSISTSIFSGVDTEDIQIPIYLSPDNISKLGAQWTTNRAAIEITDVYGNKVPFWIEYWDSDGALIWVKANLTNDESLLEEFFKMMYGFMPSFVQRWMEWMFGWLSDYYYNAFLICPSDGQPTRGDGNKVFEFFDDFSGNSLDTSKWNYKTAQGGSYSVSNGILSLQGDKDSKADVWIWTKKTFPSSYVIGMKAYLKNQPFFMWYIDSDGDAWIEHIKRTTGYLREFNINDGSLSNNKENGGSYTKNRWSRLELYIDAGDFYTYQTTGQFKGTWGSPVSEYLWYLSESDEPIGLGQIYKGPAKYDFIYVRKYLDISDMKQDSIFLPVQTKIEFIDDNPGNPDHDGDKLAILQNWTNNLDNYNGAWHLDTAQRYEVVVSKVSDGLDLTFTYNPNLDITHESHTLVDSNPNGYELYATIDNNPQKDNNSATFHWIVAAPYPYNTYTDSQLTITPSESLPSSGGGYSTARVYDIQPFIDCIQAQKYFGVPGAPSFFERLEGGDTTNRAYYERMAAKMQEAVYGAARYPIGLISFILPKDLPPNLNFLVRKQPAADYIYLDYRNYPSDDPNAKKVYGISTNGGVSSPLLDENFYLTPAIARKIFGVQGASDLLEG
ncbi:hypothetical protein A3L11_03895 [Thermococcus siculi]|uniref:DUF2341 domain-containing protein n=1 Tax=Thermococcus siculi TaxID=72803 RepID=A0A2Z2MJ39_9EURY|nr:DUF2341 domain-containing protein [Thermococcus siculi]ASJ08419.1 hypothetical protein A3L11_03895 [Thermococcus siculi]